jgi:putative transposase
MCRWRQVTPEQRDAALEHRRHNRLPWHGPPHYSSDSGLYLITAACFEHHPVIGSTPLRMSDFETELVTATQKSSEKLFAWTVMPNHYRTLVHARDLKEFLHAPGQLHGRTSYAWNGEDDMRGRQVWHRAAETEMKSERHFWASLDYVLHKRCVMDTLSVGRFGRIRMPRITSPKPDETRRNVAGTSIRSSIMGRTGTLQNSEFEIRGVGVPPSGGICPLRAA